METRKLSRENETFLDFSKHCGILFNSLLDGLFGGPPVFRSEALALEFLIESINSSTGVDSLRLGWSCLSEAYKIVNNLKTPTNTLLLWLDSKLQTWIAK